jgi:hypothetical protein
LIKEQSSTIDPTSQSSEREVMAEKDEQSPIKLSGQIWSGDKKQEREKQ